MLEFDPKKQREYVLGARKRKMQRRIEGAQAAKDALRKQLAQEKRLRQEDARSIYNMNCQVPIMSDLRLATQPDIVTMRKMKDSGIEFKEKGAQHFTKDPSTRVLVTSEPLAPPKLDGHADVEVPDKPVDPGAKWTLPETLHSSIESLRHRSALKGICASKPKVAAHGGGKRAKFDVTKFRKQMKRKNKNKGGGKKKSKSKGKPKTKGKKR
jgi:hypothetical protein